MPVINSQLAAVSPVAPETKTANAGQQAKTDDAKLKATCTEFEAVFINLMLSQMRKTVPKDALLPQSSGQDIMQSMLDTEMTKNMSHAGGIGLADMLYRQLKLTDSSTNITTKGQAPR
ncbi:MAG: rod-binding protein [Negativicutes bacterium]|nr:rod-binding protein [Negativicutes bacterium]